MVFEQSLMLMLGCQTEVGSLAAGICDIPITSLPDVGDQAQKDVDGSWGQRRLGGGCSLVFLLSIYCPNRNIFLTNCSDLDLWI